MITIPVYATGIITAALGFYLKSTKVKAWMNARRIDGTRKEIDLGYCEICGQKLKRIKTLSGKRAGQEAAVCKHYPECTYVKWGE